MLAFDRPTCGASQHIKGGRVGALRPSSAPPHHAAAPSAASAAPRTVPVSSAVPSEVVVLISSTVDLIRRGLVSSGALVTRSSVVVRFDRSTPQS
mmetsp:Transcript_46234/g.121213  ORF Transcript_46234/g.121213 Transcript_46234/m.121213 type:complete len:95 (+) Transcript_46234:139-423(+)